jgi:hypothetical protein
MKVSEKKMMEILDSIQKPMAEFRTALMAARIDTKIWSDLDTKAIAAVTKIWDKQKDVLGYK